MPLLFEPLMKSSPCRELDKPLSSLIMFEVDPPPLTSSLQLLPPPHGRSGTLVTQRWPALDCGLLSLCSSDLASQLNDRWNHGGGCGAHSRSFSEGRKLFDHRPRETTHGWNRCN